MIGVSRHKSWAHTVAVAALLAEDQPPLVEGAQHLPMALAEDQPPLVEGAQHLPMALAEDQPPLVEGAQQVLTGDHLNLQQTDQL